MSATDNLNLPVIDFAELDNESTKAEFYRKLRSHARNYGFFYLINHGIDPKERDNLLEASKKFFALPQEEKDKISMDLSPHFRGYTKTGNENTRKKTDYREVLDIGEELTARRVPEEDFDNIQYNMSGPNLWPEKVPELEVLAMNWFHKVKELTIKLLRAFMVALEQPEDAIDELLSGVPIDLLKIAHYPANTVGESQEQGLGPHKDTGLLTMLWQDETGGLQVFTEENGWIDAVPLKNSFIVNIGETLELATNGYLTADIHQVVSKVNVNKPRYSIPFFLRPTINTKQIPLLKLPEELQKQARGPASDPMNPLFLEPGKNVMKARLRAHLNTTKNFYPNLYKIIRETGNVSWS